jgi:hypothetical protein
MPALSSKQKVTNALAARVTLGGRACRVVACEIDQQRIRLINSPNMTPVTHVLHNSGARKEVYRAGPEPHVVNEPLAAGLPALAGHMLAA